MRISFFFVVVCPFQSLTLHFVVLSFDRYSRDDVIGEVLLPVSEALEDMTGSSVESRAVVEPAGGGVTLFRDIAPRSLKVKIVVSVLNRSSVVLKDEFFGTLR